MLSTLTVRRGVGVLCSTESVCQSFEVVRFMSIQIKCFGLKCVVARGES